LSPKCAKKQFVTFGKKLQKNTVVQALRVHQHTLQLLKNTILSRNLYQICLKMRYFLEKAGKIAAALEAPPQPPSASGGWGL